VKQLLFFAADMTKQMLAAQVRASSASVWSKVVVGASGWFISFIFQKKNGMRDGKEPTFLVATAIWRMLHHPLVVERRIHQNQNQLPW
jgi:hypothetical protein